MKITLISCSKIKKGYPCIAAEMYSPSQLFSLSYNYAKRVSDKIFILSAKYGLLEETDLIEPYDLSLQDLTDDARLNWANDVLKRLKEKCNPENDEFIILTGKDYYVNLLYGLKHFSLPLEHQNLDQRLESLQKWLRSPVPSVPEQQNEPCRDKCDELHRIFNALKRYSPFEIDSVPFENGIYIIFEKGERYKEFDRIVRVGTHDSPNRLKLRLKFHFEIENKDGSIFRKNVGKAILNRDKSPYLAIWSLDSRKEENKIYIIDAVQRDTERKVSAYLNENISFAVFPVSDGDQRLRLEEAVISTLHHCAEFGPGQEWLGNRSTEEEIRTSGMWLKKGLNATPLTDGELNYIKAAVRDLSVQTI